MKKIDVKNLEIQDVLYWIVLNAADTAAMDSINFSSYPHTSKYKKQHNIEPQNLDDI